VLWRIIVEGDRPQLVQAIRQSGRRRGRS